MAITVTSPTTSSATLTTTGLGSGLDINSLVTKLMAVEQQPLTLLQTQEAAAQAKITAYGSLKGAVAGLQTAAQTLANPATFSAQTATVGNASVATASANGTADLGAHTLEVTTLAQAQRLTTSTTYTDTATQVGTGTLTIDFGTFSGGSFTPNPNQATKTITIASGQGSLAGIRDAINAGDYGVTASIINDGSGYRLMLTSDSAGTANMMRVVVSTTSGTLGDLAYNPAGGSTSMSEVQSSKDAQFKLDGVSITKSSNTVTDVIGGVTLNLLATNSGSPTSLTVARNTSAIQSALGNLVSTYNTAASTIAGLTAYDAATKKGSVLLGDITTLSIQAQIRSVLNTRLAFAGGGITSLADLGVGIKKDGTLSLDSTKLATVLNDATKDPASFFTALGKSTDSLVSYAGSTSDTKPGSYAVNVSQLATRGQATSAFALPTQVDLSTGAQTLDMTINGTAGTVSIANGTYTQANLVATLQSAINGSSAFSANGIAVTVGMNGTRASVGGSTAAGKTITAGVNDTLDVTIDGTTVAGIALTAGTYATAAALASMVQSKINAAFSGGKSVTVSEFNGVLTVKSDSYGTTSNVTVADGGGTTGATGLLGAATQTGSGSGTAALTIASNSFGAATNVSVGGGSAAATLFGAATLAGTAGVDVAGTIDGIAATGLGQKLTAASGAAKGLQITVAGGLTGSRGAVNFDRGMADQLNTTLQSILDSSSGVLTAATDSLNKTVQSYQSRQTELQAQLAVIQQRYLQQFNAMDALVASMQQTSSFLTQQLTAMQAFSINSKK